ncbi:hypothetical protein ACHAXR_011318 [Thalassiosira sp. AJA248-18]
MERRGVDPFLLSNSNKKGVCFASVQVREYPVILGDNPSCTSGAPIALSWNHDLDSSISIDEWEGQRCIERRTKEEIRIPASVRAEWLLDAGYSVSHVHEVIQDVEAAKRRRRSSIVKSSFQDKAEVVAETMKRKLGRATGKRERSNTLYKQWSASQ